MPAGVMLGLAAGALVICSLLGTSDGTTWLDGVRALAYSSEVTGVRRACTPRRETP